MQLELGISHIHGGALHKMVKLVNLKCLSVYMESEFEIC